VGSCSVTTVPGGGMVEVMFGTSLLRGQSAVTVLTSCLTTAVARGCMVVLNLAFLFAVGASSGLGAGSTVVIDGRVAFPFPFA
jgi:hypothetical protein